MASEANHTFKWISDFADPDPAVRQASGLRLYLVASVLVSPVFNEWLKDPEFRALVRNDPAEGVSPEKAHYVVGIAVQPEHFGRIRAANGTPRLSDVPPDQDAIEFELRFGDTHHFDILTTREPFGSGVIARYLARFGEGIQQIELHVTDVDRATGILRARFGLAPIYPATRPGADGTRVNFFLVSLADGKKFLLELVEPAARK